MLSKSVLRSVARSIPSRSMASSSSSSSSFPRFSPSLVNSSSTTLLRRFASATPPPAGEAAAASAATEGGAAKEGGEAVVEDPKLKELEAKLEEQSKKVAELTTALQYSAADFQNLQRRSALELTKSHEFAIQRFAGDLLSTIDILSLALKHVPNPVPSSNPELKTLFDGVTMTQTELLKTLKKHGVVQFDPTGEKFDPNLHEALYQAPIPGKEPGTVSECTQLGYMLRDRTLRAAQVGVVTESS
ncbi:GrpE-domain-containing protein [Mrakia frigida]|uniref:mitochondrial nucleotide exchange factor MGE1 n=1 Tax=Mrakia frigida TaxID=29902 RepID=UPI003FCC0698